MGVQSQLAGSKDRNHGKDGVAMEDGPSHGRVEEGGKGKMPHDLPWAGEVAVEVEVVVAVDNRCDDLPLLLLLVDHKDDDIVVGSCCIFVDDQLVTVIVIANNYYYVRAQAQAQLMICLMCNNIPAAAAAGIRNS